MPANTSPDNIQYPTAGDQIAPLNTVFQNLAQTTQTALTAANFGFRLRETLYFTSNGTFTKASYPWLRAIRVHTLGGGGAGGGCQATSASQAADAGGGGSGTYATAFITNISELAINATVGRGAGGTPGAVGNFSGGDGQQSFFSNLCSSQGGGGGFGGGASGSFARSSGGFTGDTGVGDFIVQGSDGGNGFVAGGASGRQGIGAAAPAPYGAGARRQATSGTGAPGKSPGGGGGGASNDNSNSAVAGGAGGNGIVVLELFA